MDSTQTQPPFLGPRRPDYPPLIQLVRVMGGTIPGPSGYASSSMLGPYLYLASTQQLRSDTLIPRDREPCLVADINGGGLSPGYYLGRLAGSYTSLPLYEVGGSPLAVTSAGSTSTAMTVNQTAHGFTTGTVVYNSSGTWTRARADSPSTTAIAVVQVINENSYYLIFGGPITGLSLTSSTWYYLSQTTPGLLTSTEPTYPNVTQPILFTISATIGIVLAYRPMLVFPSPTGGPPFNDTLPLLGNNADPTKRLLIDTASIPTGTDRTWTAQSTSGTVPLLEATQTFTGPNTISRSGLATTPSSGLTLTNPTAATGGSTVQYSPSIQFTGSAWNTGSLASHPVDWIDLCVPVSGNPVTLINSKQARINGGTLVIVRELDSRGRHLIYQPSVGTNRYPAYIARNDTAGANGAPQYSPGFQYIGQAWDPGAGVSKTVDFIEQVVTVQGSPPTGTYTISAQIDSGGYTDVLTVTSGGTVTATAFEGDGSALTGVAVEGTIGKHPQWMKVTIPYTVLEDAGTSKTYTMYTLPAGGVLHAIKYRVTTTFAGATGFALKMGYSNGAGGSPTVNDHYVTLSSVASATLPSFSTTNQPDCQDQTGTWDVTLTASVTIGSLNDLSAGSMDVWFLVSVAS